MTNRHREILKEERERLYEDFLNAPEEEKSDLLLKIMELDEEIEAFDKIQKSHAAV